MAVLVLKDASVTINSVDLSSSVQSVTLTYNANMLDASVMGVSAMVRLAGLIDWSVQITFLQDFDSGSVDATLFSLVGAAAFPIVIKPTSSAVGATNPSFTGNVVLQSYAPVTGKVGDINTIQAQFQSSGDLTRAIA